MTAFFKTMAGTMTAAEKTCKNCLHWAVDSNAIADGFGYCLKKREADMLYWTQMGFVSTIPRITIQEFGCNQFDGKNV